MIFVPLSPEQPRQQVRPAIDHGVLSPNGRISKRARAEALKREHDLLFPAGFWNEPAPTEREKAEAKAKTLLASAANLRDLAARGMSTRKYTRAAEKLEAEAAALLASE